MGHRYEVSTFTLSPGSDPFLVVTFNTSTFNYIEINISGGDVLRMSDDCTDGLLIRAGSKYNISPTDYSRADPEGEEVEIRMKCAGETVATVTVSKSYYVRGR